MFDGCKYVINARSSSFNSIRGVIDTTICHYKHTKVEDAVIDMRRMPCSQKRNARSQERTKIGKM